MNTKYQFHVPKGNTMKMSHQSNRTNENHSHRHPYGSRNQI